MRLIEDPKSEKPGAAVRAIGHQGLNLFSSQVLAGRLSFLKERSRKWFGDKDYRRFDIKTINTLLGLSVFALLLYFCYSLYFSVIKMDDKPDFGLEIKKAAEGSTIGDVSLLKAVSFYLDRVNRRNIFEMGELPPEEGVEVVVEPVPSGSIEGTQSLRLVGISWSDIPDAMIEDAAALRTFFVKEGEMIGKYKVKAIFKNKVILSGAGEEIELR